MPATSHASRRGARPPRTRRPSSSDGTCSSRRATERLRSCKSTEGRERLSARQRAYRGNCRFHPVPRRGGPASRRTAFGNVRATSPSTSPAWASTSPRRACSTMSVPSGSSFQFLRTASRRRALAAVSGRGVADLASDCQAHPGGTVSVGRQKKHDEKPGPMPDTIIINRSKIGPPAYPPLPWQAEGPFPDGAPPGVTRR